MKSPRSLVLGAAVGYDWPKIAPFAHSLQQSGCKAEVVLLVGRIDGETRRELVSCGIRLIHVQRLVRHLPATLSRKRFNRRRLGWLHRALIRTIGSAAEPASPRLALLARVAAWFHHPACARYFEYFRFLRPRVQCYTTVLTTDVRDVVFQADPFSFGAPLVNGCVFLEHDATHGQDIGNDRWIEMGFGSEGLTAVRGRRVTCSGLTMAPSPLMLDYLAEMTRTLALRTDRLAGFDGVDQGVHNWLFWTGRLPGFVARDNFQGPVLTMHGLPGDLVHVDENHRVMDSSGKVIPVLHQYDRHPSLAAALANRAGVFVARS